MGHVQHIDVVHSSGQTKAALPKLIGVFGKNVYGELSLLTTLLFYSIPLANRHNDPTKSGCGATTIAKTYYIEKVVTCMYNIFHIVHIASELDQEAHGFENLN